MFIDTHCHLTHDDYDDIDLVIKENRENGVDKIVVSACTKESILECWEVWYNNSKFVWEVIYKWKSI